MDLHEAKGELGSNFERSNPSTLTSLSRRNSEPKPTMSTSDRPTPLRSQNSSPRETDAAMRTSGSTSSACLGPLNPLAQEFQPIVNPPPAPPPPPTAGKLYELRRTAYKGFGLFATRFIPIGTRILVESPLLTIPDDALHLAWAPYCRLSNAQKAAFDKLHDWAPRYLELDRASRVHLLDPFNRGVGGEGVEAAVAEHIRVMSIFACNNFSVPCGLAVFETASRLNHSCVPNLSLIHISEPTRPY